MSLNRSDGVAAYGAVYQTGDYVQRGNVVGLSADGGSVVVAPMSGWVRLIEAEDLWSVEIWRNPEYDGEAGCQLEIAR